MLTGKMCFNVKQYVVCINKLELVDSVLFLGTLLSKGQINIQIRLFLIRDNLINFKSHSQILHYIKLSNKDRQWTDWLSLKTGSHVKYCNYFIFQVKAITY